jgi:hypothetical protein
MLFFPKLRKSWKRTNDLRELQIAVAWAVRSADSTATAQAVERYLDLCIADENLRAVLKRNHLERDDLRAHYEWLSAGGLGRWVNGHHTALSSIAYAEPLEYLASSERRGEDRGAICGILLEYWLGSVSKQKLMSMAAGSS